MITAVGIKPVMQAEGRLLEGKRRRMLLNETKDAVEAAAARKTLEAEARWRQLPALVGNPANCPAELVLNWRAAAMPDVKGLAGQIGPILILAKAGTSLS